MRAEQLEALARRVAPLGRHIQIYADCAKILESARLLAKLSAEVVIDHCGELKTVLIVGLPEFEALLRHLDSGRAWMKVCSYRASSAEAHWTDVAANVKFLVAAAPDRCLWGADWPHAQMNPTPEARVPLDQFLELVPDITVRPEILVEIPALSYGF